MEAYMTQISNYLLRQSWQIAILVVVVAVVSWLLRNKSAHVRYLLWLIILAKCLVPPFLTVPLAVLPEPKVATVLRSAEPIVAAPVLSPVTEIPATPKPVVAKHTHKLTHHKRLVIGWIMGVAIFITVVVTKALRTEFWLRRERKPLPAGLRSEIKELFSNLGVRISPKLWLLEGIGQPFVWGLLRGGIYLPVNFANADNAEHRRGILVHELSHILRFDAAVNLLQIVAQTLFWFHPFVWWANRKIRAEREKCCDEMVIARLGARAKDYSDAIVKILIGEHESTRSVPSLAIAGPVKNIEERIKIMLRPGKKFYKQPSSPAVAIVILTALFAIPTSVVLTARAENKPTTRITGANLVFGNPTNLGPIVNSSAYEWGPHISSDGLSLYFLSQRPRGLGRADIWMTTRKTKDESWGTPVNLGPPVNTSEFEGAPCLSADGLEMYFVSDRPGGSGSLDIWVTKRKTKDSPWGTPVNLGQKVNSDAAENGPSISANGLELYFSDASWSSPPPRPGGMGQADIWVTTRKSRYDPWDTPVNLSPTVNGPYKDCSPSISTDGLSLYFHSTRPGYGEPDIWVTTRETKDEPWDPPINLGPPVSSSYMEWNPNISSDGSTLYFVSGGRGTETSSGRTDIWQVPLKTEAKPAKSLERAAIYGDIDQVRLNLSLGADVNAKGMHERTALHYAANKGYIEIARVLIGGGAYINTRNENGRTPLHFAAQHHNLEMIELLIAKGADLNSKDDGGMTPISIAMTNGGAGREVVDLLVSKGADIPALHLDAYRGELRKVQQSLDEHRNVDSRDNSGRTALHYAAGAGQTHVVEFLIARTADVNAKAENSATPLHCAAGVGWINVAELLIAKGADVNARDRGRATALHIAAWAGHEDLANLLISKGTDVTAKDQYGYVPLHAVAWTGLAEVAELLIAKGNDPDAKDIWGITPLHHAVENDRSYKVAELFIASGADVNSKNKWGGTPLHCAVWHAWMYGNKVSGVVTLLLQSGAEVNAKDNSGWTVLCYTADYGQKKLTDLLIANGADVNVKTKDGKTPLSLAEKKDHTEIVELLRKHGAKE